MPEPTISEFVKMVDLAPGDWFKYNGGIYIKMSPFQSGGHTYESVFLVDGRPSFISRTSTADPPALSEWMVEVVSDEVKEEILGRFDL